MKIFTFVTKNEDGSVRTSYQEEITEKQEQELKALIYSYVQENCR